MKRYMLFIYDRYYPGGGMKDFNRSCDTIEEAWNHFDLQHSYELFQIYDLELECIVKTNDETIRNVTR